MASMRGMEHWRPTVVAVQPAANQVLPGSRSRGEVDILIVDGYRKVVLAHAGRLRRRGTFFSTTS